MSEDTAILPPDWKTRLVAVRNANTGGATAWCLEVHDLAVSKLVAGREKDLQFVGGLLRHKLVEMDTLSHRLDVTSIDKDMLALCKARLLRLSTQA